MKKFFICLFVLILSLSLFSCNDKKEDSVNIQYGVKYIHKSTIGEPEDKQDYYIFNSNGTAIYHYYYNYSNDVYSYTVNYICEFVAEEDTVFCFYDSIVYDDVHNKEKYGTKFSSTVMISKNVIMESSGDLFIAENYLDKIPNFGKTSSN